jgi:hypothetical protein
MIPSLKMSFGIFDEDNMSDLFDRGVRSMQATELDCAGWHLLTRARPRLNRTYTQPWPGAALIAPVTRQAQRWVEEGD